MVFILAVFLVYAVGCYVDISPYGSFAGCPLANHIFFSFIHLNPIHLCLNCSIFAFYWFSFLRRTRLWLTVPVVVLSTVAASFASASDVPTVGLSACVMAMAGLLSSVVALRPMLKTITLVLISGCVTYFFAPAVNTPIHLWSYFLALVCGLLLRRKMHG